MFLTIEGNNNEISTSSEEGGVLMLCIDVTSLVIEITSLLVGVTYYFTAMHSISTRAPLGRVLTAIALRAGKGAWKN